MTAKFFFTTENFTPAKIPTIRYFTLLSVREMSKFAIKGLEAFDKTLFLSPTPCYPNPNPT